MGNSASHDSIELDLSQEMSKKETGPSCDVSHPHDSPKGHDCRSRLPVHSGRRYAAPEGVLKHNSFLPITYFSLCQSVCTSVSMNRLSPEDTAKDA